MSPSARGLVPGLLLALAAAFGVLAVNDTWLLPALDATGVRWLAAAPDLAAGHAPAVPLAAWDVDGATSGLEGEGKLVPLLMAAGVRAGARAHVAALWVLAGSVGAAALALSWGVGGVAGIGAALLGGTLLLASPLVAEAAGALGPDPTVAALFLVLLGAMAYRPRGWALHGLLAALAWAAGPVGLGALAAAVAWPLVLRATPRERGLGAFLALLPSVALVAAGVRWPVLAPPAWAWGGHEGTRATLDGMAAWATHGGRGPALELAGISATLALVGLALREGRTAPRPPGSVPWSDPAAPDALAVLYRPAAHTLLLGAALGAAGAPRGPLDRPWLAAALVLTALAAATAARLARRGRPGRVAVALLVAWALVGAWRTRESVAEARAAGRGLTARVWVESPVIRWIDNRSGPYAEIYATEPALVLLQTGRGARSMPAPGAARLDAFAERFAARPGAIVLTGAQATDAWAVTLSSRLGLVEAVRADEGRVLVPGG